MIYNKTPLEKIVSNYSAISILSEMCIHFNSLDPLNINTGNILLHITYLIHLMPK